MDHPGAFRHPTDSEARPLRDRLLRVGVGGQDRLGCGRPALVRQRRGGVSKGGHDLVEREPLADHAGREDEHLLRVQPKQPRRFGRGRPRAELAAYAGRRVRDSGVDDDGLRLRELEMLL